MPHISIKMLRGRTNEQKERVAKAVEAAVCKELSVGSQHISVSIEDFTAVEWQDIYKAEITEKQSSLYIKPDYDPRDLLLK